jgi:hypothetical protein
MHQLPRIGEGYCQHQYHTFQHLHWFLTTKKISTQGVLKRCSWTGWMWLRDHLQVVQLLISIWLSEEVKKQLKTVSRCDSIILFCSQLIHIYCFITVAYSLQQQNSESPASKRRICQHQYAKDKRASSIWRFVGLFIKFMLPVYNSARSDYITHKFFSSIPLSH